MDVEFIDLRTQYLSYQAEIDQAIKNVLTNSQFIMGEEIAAFERELCNFVGCEHTITCASGTDAIMLVLLALGLKPGDEIITSVFSFIAVAEVVALLKLKPVFVDIEETTYNLNSDQIADKISSRTRAIVPVSLYGQPADLDEINAIAKDYAEKFQNKIYVIEDAAQSLGATYQAKQSGNLSDFGCTSFFPSKPLGCYGDGGAIFTNDAIASKKLSALRIHGQTKRYFHQYIGVNARLDSLQAAILRVKLNYFAKEIKKREAVANAYDQLLQHPNIIIPTVKKDRRSIYAQYSIRVKERDALANYLKTQGIPIAIHYPLPLHLQPCFSFLSYKPGDFPVAERIANEIISLPMHPFMTQKQQLFIADEVLKFANSEHLSVLSRKN